MSTLAATAEDPIASRETELRRFQFEQMLAFMRALGKKVVPNSPYDPLPRIQFPDAKAQFERAGGKLVPIPPTNDQLLEQAIARTYQQMLAPGGCCPCSAAATCSDGLFCNGAEVCTAGNCARGPAPCVDANPCTTDSCTENTDTCSFTPVQPAVAQLNLSRSTPSTTVAALAWPAVTGASSYNIYRGTSANLSDLACFVKGVTATSRNDDGAVPVRAFYYLVTSVGCGESGLGNVNPSPRPPPPGCP